MAYVGNRRDCECRRSDSRIDCVGVVLLEVEEETEEEEGERCCHVGSDGRESIQCEHEGEISFGETYERLK